MNVLNIPFFYVIGAKDFQCKHISLLVSLRKMIDSNFPLPVNNKTSKNDILPLCSTSYVSLIFS